jgi:hypothetical protein
MRTVLSTPFSLIVVWAFRNDLAAMTNAMPAMSAPGHRITSVPGALRCSLARIALMKQNQWNSTAAPRSHARRKSLCCRTGLPQRPQLR